MHKPIKFTSARTYFFVYVALMVLLAATISAAFLDLGSLNTVIAVSIAVLKAALVVTFFMGMIREGQVIRLFLIAGFLWLAILVFLTWVDYYTRTRGFSTWPPR